MLSKQQKGKANNMGYFATGTGRFTISDDKRVEAYHALCKLNDRDEWKRGGSYGGENDSTTKRPAGLNYHPGRWYSWLEPNYPETCHDLIDILQALGFDIDDAQHSGTGLTTFFISYNDKVGQEDLFLEALSPYLISGYIEWQGEDGEWWRNFLGHDYSEFTDELAPDEDGSMTTQQGLIVWK